MHSGTIRGSGGEEVAGREGAVKKEVFNERGRTLQVPLEAVVRLLCVFKDQWSSGSPQSFHFRKG